MLQLYRFYSYAAATASAADSFAVSAASSTSNTSSFVAATAIALKNMNETYEKWGSRQKCVNSHIKNCW